MKINFTNIILIIISIIFILCIINNLLNDNIISKNIVDKFSSSDEKNQLRTNLNNLESENIDDKIDKYTIDTKDYENTIQEQAMHKFWFYSNSNSNNNIEYENEYFFLLNNNTTNGDYKFLCNYIDGNDNNKIKFQNITDNDLEI